MTETEALAALLENRVAVNALSLLALALLAYLLEENDQVLVGRKRWFQAAVLLAGVAVAAELGTVLADAVTFNARGLSLVCNVLTLALTPVIPVLMGAIFDLRSRKRKLLAWVPCGVNGLCALLSPPFGLLFTLSEDNGYTRGPLFPLFAAVCLWSMLSFAGMVLRQNRYRQYHVQGKLFLLLLFLLMGTGVQIVRGEIHSSWLCVTIVLLLYYGILTELDDKLDAVTQLYTRRVYELRVRRLEQKAYYAVVLLDVDDFQQVNDTWGLAYGDWCLATLADLLQQAVGGKGSCFRYGGDEFCVLYEHSDRAAIDRMLDKFFRTLAQRRQREPNLPGMSCGCALHRPEDDLTFEQVLRQADHRMYTNQQNRKRKEPTLF